MTTDTFTWNRNDWTPLGEMADGFDEYRPPSSDDLEGSSLTLECRTPGRVQSDHTLTWRFAQGLLHWTRQADSSLTEGTETYELFRMQPGLYFIHYRVHLEDHPVVVTGAIDINAGQLTATIGELGLQPDPHLARQTWFQGSIVTAEHGDGAAHATTDELIGHRIRYAYSSDDVYDHIYLNRQLFTWCCVGGAEKGLADTDRTTTWKLRDKTYLFSWLEKNVGVEGVVLIDLNAMRTVGIQFGLDQHTGDLVNITMGAYAEDLGRVPDVTQCRPGPPSV